MSLAHNLLLARASSTGNPITRAFTLSSSAAVLVLLLKINGGTDRAGGAPSVGGISFTQANSTQKAASSPEAGVELWYLLNPRDRLLPGSQTLTIPNTGGLTVFSTLCDPTCPSGRTHFIGANGSNGTSTNPTANAVGVGEPGTIGYAVCCSGLVDFDPATPSHTGFETGTGTPLGTFDDGAHGGGQQHATNPAVGQVTMGWTASSDDWGCVAAFFGEVPTTAIGSENYRSGIAGNGSGTGEVTRL